jgi:4-hydroxy-4-methyl-2-oxoglutarate aldolase
LVADLQGGAHGHWGEILAVAAQHRGITGLVVDGGVRDSEELGELAFPVFARMVTVVGTAKNYRGEFALPVQVGDVTITSRDIVIADADAVVAIPAIRLAEVVAKADQRTADEQNIITRLRLGASTVDIYHLDGMRLPR